jgi:hypothetical protein
MGVGWLPLTFLSVARTEEVWNDRTPNGITGSGCMRAVLTGLVVLRLVPAQCARSTTLSDTGGAARIGAMQRIGAAATRAPVGRSSSTRGRVKDRDRRRHCISPAAHTTNELDHPPIRTARAPGRVVQSADMTLVRRKLIQIMTPTMYGRRIHPISDFEIDRGFRRSFTPKSCPLSSPPAPQMTVGLFAWLAVFMAVVVQRYSNEQQPAAVPAEDWFALPPHSYDPTNRAILFYSIPLPGLSAVTPTVTILRFEIEIEIDPRRSLGSAAHTRPGDGTSRYRCLSTILLSSLCPHVCADEVMDGVGSGWSVDAGWHVYVATNEQRQPMVTSFLKRHLPHNASTASSSVHHHPASGGRMEFLPLDNCAEVDPKGFLSSHSPALFWEQQSAEPSFPVTGQNVADEIYSLHGCLFRTLRDTMQQRFGAAQGAGGDEPKKQARFPALMVVDFFSPAGMDAARLFRIPFGTSCLSPAHKPNENRSIAFSFSILSLSFVWLQLLFCSGE